MEISLKIDFKRPGNKIWYILATIFLATTLIALYLVFHNGSSLPPDVRSQLDFKSVYAPNSIVEPDSFKYTAQGKTLTFNVSYQGTKLSFSEQPAPSNLANDTGGYFQSLGLHPVAQFISKIGSVAVVNFYTPKTYEPGGQAAVLVTSGTLVIATTVDKQQKLTNDQWKKLFDSLKISR